MKTVMLFLFLFTVAAQANDSEDARFNTACADFSDPSTVTDLFRPKAVYCDAARVARHASTADGVVSKVWMGVAGVCSTACATTISMALPYCNVSNLGASGTEAAVSHDFDALVSAGTTLGTTKGFKDLLKPAEGRSTAACATAILAAKNAFAKAKSSGDNHEKFLENLQNAEDFKIDAKLETIGGGGDAGVQANGRAPNAMTKAATAAAPDCGNSSADDVVPCAMTQEPALANFVTQPTFAQDFKTATSQDLGHFVLMDFGSPGAGLAVSMSGAIKDGAAPELVAALKKLADENGDELIGTAYASKGPLPEKKTAETGPDFGGLVAALFGSHKGKHGGDKVVFNERGPASNPSSEFGPFPDGIGPAHGYSLFQRVSLRYVHVYRYGMW